MPGATHHLDIVIQRLMGQPEWKRLKMMITGAEHDADREKLVSYIKKKMIEDLTEFRKGWMGRPKTNY